MATTRKRNDEQATSLSNKRSVSCRCRHRKEKGPSHLYLVLDDWSWGYSIRKIDLSPDDPGQELIPEGLPPGSAITVRQRLPPPFFRFRAPRSEPKYFAGAFKSKILAIQKLMDDSKMKLPWEGVPTYDVRTLSFIFAGQRWPDMLEPIYIPIGDMLFVLAAGSLVRLNLPPFGEPCSVGNEWSKLPEPTVESKHVISYAIHPSERTFFVSIGRSVGPATFYFDMEENKWVHHGQWQLPFIGRGYFDPDLEAWVGLSSVTGTFGHLCSCDVPSIKEQQQCPDLKISKEKLFSKVPAVERHTGTTLVYMGGGSRFCLLECVNLHAELADEVNERTGKHLLKLTTFSLKYDNIGDLTTGNSCRVRYCNLPRKVTLPMLEHPVAFWM